MLIRTGIVRLVWVWKVLPLRKAKSCFVSTTTKIDGGMCMYFKVR